MTPPPAGRVRLSCRGDIPRLFAIRHAVAENRLSDPEAVTPEDCERVIGEAAMFVWEEDGDILGFSAADPDDGSVWALFVAPGQDGRGIGRALLARACERLREAGHGVATLRTGAGTRAEGFYRAAGWIEQRRDDKGEIVFRLPL
ncbi:MAG: GNAT family N-acetyltransferase [Alphaproteobacteria bacterium]|nr:GNAT family N-acetyltransferase [Alphaproteobacteria bacterium]